MCNSSARTLAVNVQDDGRYSVFRTGNQRLSETSKVSKAVHMTACLAVHTFCSSQKGDLSAFDAGRTY